jgi:hypothetical protein
MNVIFDAANNDRWAIKSFRSAAEKWMQRFPKGLIPKERPAMFRGKDQMNVNG